LVQRSGAAESQKGAAAAAAARRKGRPSSPAGAAAGSAAAAGRGEGKWRRCECSLRAGLVDPDLGDLKLRTDRGDPGHHLGPQLGGHCLMATVLVHQPPDSFLKPVLAQTRAALDEVLADLHDPDLRLLELTVQVGVDARKYLATRHFMRLTAAHFASFPGVSSVDDASAGAADAVLTRPSSAALSCSSSRGFRGPPCRRGIT